MDMRKLSQALNNAQRSSNSTDPPSLTDLQPNILDALIPGYSLISRYISASTGIDISWLVTLGIILLATIKGGQFLYAKSSRAFRWACISSVYIKQKDDLFDMTLDWMAKNKISTSDRRATAKTQRGPRAQNEFEATEANALTDDGMFDFNKWSARVPPRYEPYYGRHFFWHRRRLFIFHRSKRSRLGGDLPAGLGGIDEEDIIQIDTIGRSIDPIKELLKVAKSWSLNKLRGTTTIRHPLPKERQRFNGLWSKVSVRPSRPMHTVILDPDQKDMIVKDMNDFLHPASPQWYATRGLPYRRGYLFTGPPGTGKTSLSFSLAGIFGLEIYVIGLQEPSLTEGDLMALFNSLPRRCVVLLEDVDAAEAAKKRSGDDDKKEGAQVKGGKGGKGKGQGKNKLKGANASQQNGMPTPPSEKDEQNSKKDEEFTLKDLARELKSLGGGNQKQRPNRAENEGGKGPGERQGPGSGHSGISLSGLLNAIDGVASHEGRVLIMTTNHPELLDPALVRPGRVDRKIEFTYAMRPQIKELFIRMYSNVRDDSRKLSAKNDESLENLKDEKAVVRSGKSGSATPTWLEQLADEFASHIPDATYTPAEIQNHLMGYKDEPRLAVEKIEDWIKARNKAKETKDENDADGNSDYEEDDDEDNE